MTIEEGQIEELYYKYIEVNNRHKHLLNEFLGTKRDFHKCNPRIKWDEIIHFLPELKEIFTDLMIVELERFKILTTICDSLNGKLYKLSNEKYLIDNGNQKLIEKELWNDC